MKVVIYLVSAFLWLITLGSVSFEAKQGDTLIVKWKGWGDKKGGEEE